MWARTADDRERLLRCNYAAAATAQWNRDPGSNEFDSELLPLYRYWALGGTCDVFYEEVNLKMFSQELCPQGTAPSIYQNCGAACLPCCGFFQSWGSSASNCQCTICEGAASGVYDVWLDHPWI